MSSVVSRTGPVRGSCSGMAIGTVAAVGAAFTAAPPLPIAAGPIIGAVSAWAYVTNRASAWYRHFDSTLPDALTVLASSLRAGHSLLQAVDHVAEEADEKAAASGRSSCARRSSGSRSRMRSMP